MFTTVGDHHGAVLGCVLWLKQRAASIFEWEVISVDVNPRAKPTHCTHALDSSTSNTPGTIVMLSG